MIGQETYEKLTILADAAKYDVSCSSSGVDRKGNNTLGSAAACGICHTWSTDGRCISLLKILMTNVCVYDCVYCVNRYSNDVARASFTPEEIATLTIEFYRRNYIEGLFLSSAVEDNPDKTMERIVKVLKLLRHTYQFGGYIHVKAIPGADPLLIKEAGYLADRMSVNIELATEDGLKQLAPQKPLKKLFLPMQNIKDGIVQSKEERRTLRHTPKFVPGGQSTQMIVGAAQETDRLILKRSESLYQHFDLKRVYYSAYMPVNEGALLPSVMTGPPLLREHRLYQADWLLRYYHFTADELLTETNSNLDLEFDPKMIWALNHMQYFPVEVNDASYQELLRVPGLGTISAGRIVKQRRMRRIDEEALRKMGVVLKRARFFITCNGKYCGDKLFDEAYIRGQLSTKEQGRQLSLFDSGLLTG